MINLLIRHLLHLYVQQTTLKKNKFLKNTFTPKKIPKVKKAKY